MHLKRPDDKLLARGENRLNPVERDLDAALEDVEVLRVLLVPMYGDVEDVAVAGDDAFGVPVVNGRGGDGVVADELECDSLGEGGTGLLVSLVW